MAEALILTLPTVHIHDGQVHSLEEFDHMLYAQDSAFDKAAVKYLGPRGTNSRTGLVRSKGAAVVAVTRASRSEENS